MPTWEACQGRAGAAPPGEDRVPVVELPKAARDLALDVNLTPQADPFTGSEGEAAAPRGLLLRGVSLAGRCVFLPHLGIWSPCPRDPFPTTAVAG